MDLSWGYGLKNILFRYKTFLCFKIQSWNFQKLFEIEFCERNRIFLFIFLYQLSDWVEILWGFTISFFKEVLKVSVFYLDKQKSFIPEKNIFLSRCQYQNKKSLFTGSIFREGFASFLFWISFYLLPSSFFWCLLRNLWMLFLH